MAILKFKMEALNVKRKTGTFFSKSVKFLDVFRHECQESIPKITNLEITT